MPIYRVVMEARGFPGRIFGKPGKSYGFIATRWREAADQEAAELAVVDALKVECRDLKEQWREGEPVPTLLLAEIEELSAFPEDYSETGAAWYPIDETG